MSMGPLLQYMWRCSPGHCSGIESINTHSVHVTVISKHACDCVVIPNLGIDHDPKFGNRSQIWKLIPNLETDPGSQIWELILLLLVA